MLWDGNDAIEKEKIAIPIKKTLHTINLAVDLHSPFSFSNGLASQL